MPIPFIVGGILAGAAGLMGAAMTWSASETNKEAKEILEDAKYKYDKKSSEFEKAQKGTQEELEKLAKLKTSTWQSFDRFVKAFEKIKDKPNLTGTQTTDMLNVSTTEFINDIESLSINANAIIAGTATTAVISGIALGGTSLVLGAGGVEAIASTVALEVAVGGSTAAAAVASEIIPGLAIITGPALFVSGLSKIDSSSQNLEKAERTEQEVDKACKSMNKSIKLFGDINNCSKTLYDELKTSSDIYQDKVAQLESLVDVKDNYKQFTIEEQQLLNATYLMVVILKRLTQIQIVEVKSENEDTQSQYVDREAIDNVIESCKQQRLAISC